MNTLSKRMGLKQLVDDRHQKTIAYAKYSPRYSDSSTSQQPPKSHWTLSSRCSCKVRRFIMIGMWTSGVWLIDYQLQHQRVCEKRSGREGGILRTIKIITDMREKKNNPSEWDSYIKSINCIVLPWLFHRVQTPDFLLLLWCLFQTKAIFCFTY